MTVAVNCFVIEPSRNFVFVVFAMLHVGVSITLAKQDPTVFGDQYRATEMMAFYLRLQIRIELGADL